MDQSVCNYLTLIEFCYCGFYGLFGMGEIEKREIGEREIEERGCISPVWYGEKLQREIKKLWAQALFHFSSGLRRKSRESDSTLHFPFLPFWFNH
jgi:hypothetical protein